MTRRQLSRNQRLDPFCTDPKRASGLVVDFSKSFWSIRLDHNWIAMTMAIKMGGHDKYFRFPVAMNSCREEC